MIGKMGIKFPSLNQDKLIAKAIKVTGFGDFGNEELLVHLNILLSAIEEEAQTTTIGRIAAKKIISRYLRDCLNIEAHLKQNPDITQKSITKPLIIVGLPRTGTSILFNILEQDPASRAPLTWELLYPYPPPKTATFETDPRIDEARKMVAATDYLEPRFKLIHEFGKQLPEECVAIFSHTLLSDEFNVFFNVPTYQAWYEKQEKKPIYAYHKRFLQYLQSEHMKERWLLKSPAHLPMIEELLATYPDACIIHTHRDPIKVMTSGSSLIYYARAMTTDNISPEMIGRQALNSWSDYLDKAVDARKKLGRNDKRFIDVQFEEVIENPIALVERIYTHFDMELSKEARSNMQNYIENRPRDKFGKHTYSPEAFGIDREKDGKRFKRYVEYFNVPINTGL